MKSEERHRLKENELADFLKDELESIRRLWHRHGTLVLSVVLLVLAALAGGSWMINNSSKQRSYRASQLQNLIAKSSSLQERAVMDTIANGLAMGSYTTSVNEIVGELDGLYRKENNSSVGMMALMQQAEALRSKLFFADSEISTSEKENLCSKAEELYKKIKKQFPGQPQAVGTAKFGLALVAEERGQWEEARKLYQEISQDNKLEGTAFPLMASKRLGVLDDFKQPVTFAPAPKPDPSVTPETGSLGSVTDPCDNASPEEKVN